MVLANFLQCSILADEIFTEEKLQTGSLHSSISFTQLD